MGVAEHEAYSNHKGHYKVAFFIKEFEYHYFFIGIASDSIAMFNYHIKKDKFKEQPKNQGRNQCRQ